MFCEGQGVGDAAPNQREAWAVLVEWGGGDGVKRLL